MIRKFGLVVFLLVFVSVSFSVPTIISVSGKVNVENNIVNVSSFTLSWENNSPAQCYKVEQKVGDDGVWDNHYENGTGIPLVSDPTKSLDFTGKADKKYWYRVSSVNVACSPSVIFSDDPSPAKYIIIDTSSPVVVSKSPLGVEEEFSGLVSVGFDEEMNESASFLEGDNGLVLTNKVWSDSGKTLTYNYEGKQGTNYTVSIHGVDLAGNTVNDALQFATLI